MSEQIQLEVLAKALIEEEARLCDMQGLKRGSIIIEASLKLDRDRAEKELREGFTPYPGVINNQWS